jgi:hypothetical protein
LGQSDRVCPSPHNPPAGGVLGDIFEKNAKIIFWSAWFPPFSKQRIELKTEPAVPCTQRKRAKKAGIGRMFPNGHEIERRTAMRLKNAETRA